MSVRIPHLRCEGCGCDDEHACDDPVLGTPCSWVVVSGDGTRALCSVCARILCSVSSKTRGDFQGMTFRSRVRRELAALEIADEPLVVLA